MIEKHRADLGITPRKISDEEIVAAPGVRAGQRGRAASSRRASPQRASDIDMVYLTGYGFPLHRGGPMSMPTRSASSTSSQAMKRFAANPHDDAAFWEPAPLLAKLAAEGKTFN